MKDAIVLRCTEDALPDELGTTDNYSDTRTYTPQYIEAVRESLYQLAAEYLVAVQQVG